MTQVRSFDCHSGGVPTTVVLDEVGIRIGAQHVDWLDVDDVQFGSHAFSLTCGDGTSIGITHLGRQFDACAAELRDLRGRARRPAITVTAESPIANFEARIPRSGSSPPGIVDVVLFAHVLCIEPRNDEQRRSDPAYAPLSLIREVVRDGHAITIRMRGVPDLDLRGLGARTDEFLQLLDVARSQLSAATRAAYGQVDPALAGLDAADGWAVDAAAAAGAWDDLRRAWTHGSRAEQAGLLVELAGEGGYRLGLWTEGGTTCLPFMLASIRSGDGSGVARVAVEAVHDDDRATFIFATDDLDRLNAALVLTAFRREAIALSAKDLGRWAVAVRTQPVVQWMRSVLAARIVHDERWDDQVRAALGR